MNKNKLIIFTGLLLTMIISYFYFSAQYKKKRIAEQLSKSLNATYSIDVRKSDLKSYNPELFSDLKIIFFYDDKTFYFSKEVPFLCGKSGTWKCTFDGEVEIDELKFEGNCSINEQFEFTDSTVMIRNPQSKNDDDFVSLLYFTK